MGVIWKDADWGGSDQPPQLFEGSLFQLSPFLSDVLLGKVKQGTSMVGELLDEPPVEVDKPNEGLDLFLVPQYRPFHYTGNLNWVHLH